MAVSSDSPLAERRLVTILVDLAGFGRAVAKFEALRLAELTREFYACSAEAVQSHGGRVVKFGGDSCLATFAEDDALNAIECALELRDKVRGLAERFEVDIDLGANIHLSTVVDGDFGPPAHSRYDVVGVGVIHTFKMGAGPGIRISEPVYRRLPSERRGPWQKQRPPATYTLS